MSRWVVCPRPSASLLEVVPGEVQHMDGTTVTQYVTVKGVLFARVVEPSGLVIWMQQQIDLAPGVIKS